MFLMLHLGTYYVFLFLEHGITTRNGTTEKRKFSAARQTFKVYGRMTLYIYEGMRNEQRDEEKNSKKKFEMNKRIKVTSVKEKTKQNYGGQSILIIVVNDNW